MTGVKDPEIDRPENPFARFGRRFLSGEDPSARLKPGHGAAVVPFVGGGDGALRLTPEADGEKLGDGVLLKEKEGRGCDIIAGFFDQLDPGQGIELTVTWDVI